jgi:hypothetical protein
MYTWVKTILDSPSSTRKKLKAAVLEGLKVYNAKYKKNGEKASWDESSNIQDYLEGPTEWKLQSLDPTAKKFYQDLKNEKGFHYVGIVPWVDYIMESGSQEKLAAIWNHELGSAGLMYKVNGLPAVLIVNPDLDLHDSTANKIPGNTIERMMGLGG